MRLHHVQVCCPPGGEDEARRFYADGLGLTEVDKPEALRGRGGVWFRSCAADGTVSTELHVGVQEPFAPAQKAHPAFVVDDLDATIRRLVCAGYAVDESQRDTFPPYLRVHVADGHGNRIELLQESTQRH